MGRILWQGVKGVWSVVTGICTALGLVLYVGCAILEAVAVVCLLGTMGGCRRSV